MKKIESSALLTISSLFLVAISGFWSVYLNLAKSYFQWVRDIGFLFIAVFSLIVIYHAYLAWCDQKLNADEFDHFKNTQISNLAFLLTLIFCGLALFGIMIFVGSIRHGNNLFGQPPIFWIGFESAIFFTMFISNFATLISKFTIWFKYR